MVFNELDWKVKEMSKPLYEKFSWLRNDLKLAGPKGNKIQVKGIALFPTVSRNMRNYISKELHAAARTLIGKPVTVNHDPKRIIGDVSWAECDDDDKLEYVMDISKPEYVDKLRDKLQYKLTKEAYSKKWGIDPVSGVSVEANYRWHEHACKGDVCNLPEPHGILFTALSVVEPPESPGVVGTTMELWETLGIHERSAGEAGIVELMLRNYSEFHNMPLELLETYQSDVMSKFKGGEMTNEKKTAEAHFTPSGMASESPGKPVNVEQEKEEKKEVQSGNGDEGKTHSEPNKPVVKEIAKKDEGHKSKPDEYKDVPDDQFADPTNYKYPIDKAHVMAAWSYINKDENRTKGGYSEGEWAGMKAKVKAAMKRHGHDVSDDKEFLVMPQDLTDLRADVEVVRTVLRLGEPFADYKDFDDCVAKNKSKGDAAAYCATIMRQVEGPKKESLEDKQKREEQELALKHERARQETVMKTVQDSQTAMVSRIGTVETRLAELSQKPLEDPAVKEERELAEKHERERHEQIHEELKNSQTQCCNRLGRTQEQLVEVEAYAQKAVANTEALQGDFRKIGESIDAVKSELLGKVTEISNSIPKDYVPASKFDESGKKFAEDLGKAVAEALAKLEPIITEMKGKIAGLETGLSEAKTSQKTTLDKVSSIVEAVEKKKQELDAAFKIQSEQKVKETADLSAKVDKVAQDAKVNTEKIAEKVENLETHVKSDFKAPQTNPGGSQQQGDAGTKTPYKQ